MAKEWPFESIWPVGKAKALAFRNYVNSQLPQPCFGKQTLQLWVNYQKSRENYIADYRGNIFVDFFCQGGSLPIGYNHDYMLNAVSSSKFDKYLLQRPATQFYPPHDFYDLVRETMSPLTPTGMPEVYLTGASHAITVEAAIKAALLRFEEMHNISLKEKGFSVLAFENCGHGQSLGTLGLSKESPLRTKFPSLNILTAPFPKAKLPLYLNNEENLENERKCLELIAEAIDQNMKGQPIACMLIEPIQHNNNFASREFYRKLRKLAKEKKVPFIIDEVNTGCGPTGKFWASEFWMMDDPGDILTFGKKCQLSGFFSKPEFRPRSPLQLTECWSDIGWRMVQLAAINKTIYARQLLPFAGNTGAVLRLELQRIADERKFIENVRGQGTYIGFDVPRSELETVQLIKHLKAEGVLVGLCDKQTISLRPPLTMDPMDASHLIKALRKYDYKSTLFTL